MSVSFHQVPEDEQSIDTAVPATGTLISPDTARALALKAALWGTGKVTPNPLVGAVIVDQDHKFLGAGAHLILGGPHAEVNAITAAKAATGQTNFAGCTIYITLEPCAHQGRTPPCAQNLVAEKFSHVIFGHEDPNPNVAGQGATLIKKAGISCEFAPEWAAACARRAEFFLWTTKNKIPFVGLKSAVSLDGAIALRGDRRSWITGERARAFGHYLRVKYDAIMIGTWTLLHDNPNLMPRDSVLTGPAPWRIVVDPNGRGIEAGTTARLNLLNKTNERVAWIITPLAATRLRHLLDKNRHIEFLEMEFGDEGFFEPAEMLAALHKKEIGSLLLEGGSGLYKAFITRDMVNRFHIFQTARILSGDNKINFFEGSSPALDRVPSAVEITALGDDWLTEFSGRIS